MHPNSRTGFFRPRRLTLATALATAVAGAACALPAAAKGTVEVKYLQPEQFTDVGFGAFDRERNLEVVTEMFKRLAAQLPDGQTLRVQVLDIDLAGEVRPRGAGRDIRVLRGSIDFPRMQLRYTLEADGSTLKAGEERVADASYLFNTRPQTAQDGPLPYEKRMLQRWFSDTFVAKP